MSIATLQRVAGDTGKAGFLRRYLEGTDRAVLEGRDGGRAGKGDFIKPVGAVDHPNSFRAEIFQNLRPRLHPVPREHADPLSLDTGRIRQGTKQVEDRSGCEFDAGWTDVLHGGMVSWREHEADPGLLHAPRDLFRPKLDLDAERGQDISCAGAGRQ